MTVGGEARRAEVEISPRLLPMGDAALLVVFGNAVEPALSRQVHALARAVQADRTEGWSDWGAPVPAYASVLVPFDPLVLALDEAMSRLRAVIDGMVAAGPASEETPDDLDGPVVIDVRYGGEDGPDLDEVARRTGLSTDEVIALHTGSAYQVYFLGFAPGWGYLGPLPAVLWMHRRDAPRVRVPAGSVAIAEGQTGVYPLATPGGWHLIGRTDAVLWNAHRDPPALLRAGQAVRFRAVTR